MELTSNQKGQIAELKAQMRSAEKGWICSRTSEGARYDLVLDDGKKLHRVQVKWAESELSNADGSVQVNLRRYIGNDRDVTRTKTRTYGAEEIDAVLVYVPQVDKLCWFSPKDFGDKATITIRYTPTKNGQKYKTKMVEDYVW